MNFEHLSPLSWLLIALFGFICVFFGFFWGKGASKTISRSSQLNLLTERNTNLKSDLEACTQKLNSFSQKVIDSEPEHETMSKENTIVFDADMAKQSYGKKVKLNDLKVIEGIGPKIEKLFHSFEIKSWENLSEASVDKCQEILDTGGDRYRIHNPGSWPMQSKMAHEGKWKALAKWQEEHKAGKL